MTANLKNYFPYLLPLLLIFSRSLADITIILISILFLYHSYKNIGWQWVKEKWFCFALVFFIYCLTINTAMSINPTGTFAYSIFFIRWPIFSMALAYWILNDLKSLEKFLISLTIILIFIIFDTWWQFFFEYDIFGFEKSPNNRLTGPFNGNEHVGSWIAKLALLPPLFLVLFWGKKLTSGINIMYFFIFFLIFFLSVFITGERMALLLVTTSIFITLIGLILDKIISIKKLFILGFMSFLLILIFSYFFPDTTYRSFFSTIDKIANWRTSDYGFVWQTAFEVWLQSPFIGVGLHEYRGACNDFAQSTPGYLHAIGRAACFHPHNISLQLLSETGIFGFFIFYTMVISLAISSLKIYYLKRKWLYFSLTFCIIFSCFLPIASSTSFFSNKYGAIIWLLIGVMLSVNRLYRKKSN